MCLCCMLLVDDGDDVSSHHKREKGCVGEQEASTLVVVSGTDSSCSTPPFAVGPSAITGQRARDGAVNGDLQLKLSQRDRTVVAAPTNRPEGFSPARWPRGRVASPTESSRWLFHQPSPPM